MIDFNGAVINPQVTTPKEWLLRHAGHKKIQQILKALDGNAPDLRVVYCNTCKEIFIKEFIK